MISTTSTQSSSSSEQSNNNSLHSYWDEIITGDKLAILKTDNFIVIDDFLPLQKLMNNGDEENNYYNKIVSLSEGNLLTKEESYMEDEDSGQVVQIGEHPFYTLKMNKKEHEESSIKEHVELYALTKQIGQYFQRRVVFDTILNKPEELVDDDFFNKVALCKDFENGLPVHLDNHNADTRKITIVYYTTPYVDSQEEKELMEKKYQGFQFEERNWEGGLLRVYKPSTKLYINYWETEKVDIEPKFNRAVIFYSDTIVHTVTETKLKPNLNSTTSPIREMHPPRTTVTTWIHGNDMSFICRDKVLFQRQMIKFFQN